MGQALAPLQSLGVVDLLYGEGPISEEAIPLPTPGHSLGHASLLISSGGQDVIIIGDVIVHPAQVTEPLWNIHFDEDKEQASFTREMLLDWVEADGIIIVTGHVPGTGFGRLIREGAAATGRLSEKPALGLCRPEGRKRVGAARSSGEWVSCTRLRQIGPLARTVAASTNTLGY